MAKKIKKVEEEKIEEPKEEKIEETKEVQAQSESVSFITDVKTYQGKKIISIKPSIINEKEYISITLEDGSTCQLSEQEYNEGVK